MPHIPYTLQLVENAQKTALPLGDLAYAIAHMIPRGPTQVHTTNGNSISSAMFVDTQAMLDL